MQKHQPFGWVQDKNDKAYVVAKVIGGDPDGIDGCDYSKIFNYFTFADGTPFGIKEE